MLLWWVPVIVTPYQNMKEWGPYGVVVNVLDNNIIVSKFELQLRYYFWETYEVPPPQL